MIRLLRPLSYYKEKYGTYAWGLNKLYLLMEKQHNRGQEGAGMGVVKINAEPGHEYVFRERALGSGAIQEIFDKVYSEIAAFSQKGVSDEEFERLAPFIGEINMGHLRYSTTGKSGISYVHPFLRRNNWRSRNLMLCGNFNMTNVEQVFNSIVERGQHPRLYSDTIVLLEQLGYALDKENHRLYREYRDKLSEPALTREIEHRLNLVNVLEGSAPMWDGGFVICGATGSGDIFALRDRHGIRPAFYYHDDEVVVVTSERPVLQTTFNIPRKAVNELPPGHALTVDASGRLRVERVLPEASNYRCSFERIYFSRGSDADIYRERKALGRNLVPALVGLLGRGSEDKEHDLDNTIFSFIPNTAEVAFIGMSEGLEAELSRRKSALILDLQKSGRLNEGTLAEVMNRRLRVDKIAIKDIKLRTFIAEGKSRNDLAAHVYDVTYGCVRNMVDTVVAIDDSIVRGTTLRQSVINMLDHLHPRRIVIVSSSPQVRYPDYYGIDMSRMGEFVAFRAAVEMLKEQGRGYVLDMVYRRCLEQETLPDDRIENCVKAVYEPFTQEELSQKIARMLTPPGTRATVDILYQSLEGLHQAVPSCPGDWYFSGDYPTPGGIRQVNRAFVNFYEGNPDKR